MTMDHFPILLNVLGLGNPGFLTNGCTKYESQNNKLHDIHKNKTRLFISSHPVATEGRTRVKILNNIPDRKQYFGAFNLKKSIDGKINIKIINTSSKVKCFSSLKYLFKGLNLICKQ